MKLGHRLGYTFIAVITFSLSASLAKAYCLDCGDAHQPADALPDIIRDNGGVAIALIALLSLLLMIGGIYKICVKNKPLVYNGKSFIFKLIAFTKLLLSVSGRILVLFVVTFLVAFLFSFVSYILTMTIFSWGNPSAGLDLMYVEEFKYVDLIMYFIMAWVYANLLLKKSKKLNSLILAAVLFFVFGNVYLIPLTIVG